MRFKSPCQRAGDAACGIATFNCRKQALECPMKKLDNNASWTSPPSRVRLGQKITRIPGGGQLKHNRQAPPNDFGNDLVVNRRGVESEGRA
jgi:hypothetical protein